MSRILASLAILITALLGSSGAESSRSLTKVAGALLPAGGEASPFFPVGAEPVGTFELRSHGKSDVRVAPRQARLEIGDGSIRAKAVQTNEVRNVNPLTGEPQQPVTGNPTAFDDLCAWSLGVLALDPSVCTLTLFNGQAPIADLAGVPVNLAASLTQAQAGTALGGLILGALAGLPPFMPFPGSVLLNTDPFDGPPPASSVLCTNPTIRFLLNAICLAEVLTDEQEGLQGCGAFYGTDCDRDGAFLFAAEAGAVLAPLPGLAPDLGPPARDVAGQQVILPGARRISDPGYDPATDGCVGPLPSALDPGGLCAGSTALVDPRSGVPFGSEAEALASNVLVALEAISLGLDPSDPDCDSSTPEGCDAIAAFYSHAVTEFADDPSGSPRQRWLWETGAQYEITHASGGLAAFAGGVLHAMGPVEPTLAPGAAADVPFLLVAPDGSLGSYLGAAASLGPKKATVCHKGRRTLTVSGNAVPAHLAHGDTEGPCP